MKLIYRYLPYLLDQEGPLCFRSFCAGVYYKAGEGPPLEESLCFKEVLSHFLK